MITNPDYDLARPLASALRAKAPYVGIPIPGHAPLIFNRLFLFRAMKGVRPVNIEVLTFESGERYLIVDGIADERFNGHVCIGRVRHHMKVRSIPRARFRAYGRNNPANEMEKWKPTVAAAPAPVRTSKYDKAIAKLEKQLAKLGPRPKIFNPAVATSDDDYNRDTWLAWHQQKALRGKIGALAKKAHTGQITARELYPALATLTTIKRFSDLNTREKEQLSERYAEGSAPTFFDFANPKALWRFMPNLAKSYGGARPSLYGDAWDAPNRWGAHRYNVILEWSRERRELLSQIEATRIMATDAAGKPRASRRQKTSPIATDEARAELLAA
jgi:hypothetical protein